MSVGQQLATELISSVGDLMTLLFTALVTSFVSPLFSLVAGLLGISAS